MGGECLRIESGRAAGTLLAIEPELLIGREVPAAGQLPDERLSRRHARVSRQPDGRLLIEDLGSTNGTFVNGSRIGGPVELKIGDRVEVGATRLSLVASPNEPIPEAVADHVAGQARAEAPVRARPPQGRPSVIRAGLPPSMKGLIFPSIGLLVVQIIVGYEWLISSLTKMVRGGFPAGLGDELSEMSQEAAGWYRAFLDAVVIPNGVAFGYLIEISELLVGITLIVAAFLWLFRWQTMGARLRTAMLTATILAALGGISMNILFYLASGDNPPFFLAKSPFDEGVGLDVVMPALEVVLVVVAAWTLLSLRRGRTRSVAAPGGPHVVVAGGGFAGVAAARELEDQLGPDVRITLVSDANYLLYTPLLPEAAAGALDESTIAIPLRDRLARTELVLGRVVGGDPEVGRLDVERLTLPERPGRHTVAPSQVESIPYDRLVVAPGSVSRPRDVPGLSQYGIGFKTLAEASALRNWIVRTLEMAEGTPSNADADAYLTYVFVGAGFAGLEGAVALRRLAAKMLGRYPRCSSRGMRWVLVQSGPRIMPEISERLAGHAARRLERAGIEILTGTSLVEVGADHVRLSTGATLPTRTVVWTAGVRAHPVVERLGLRLDATRRVAVNEYLQALGNDRIWALGDAASVPDPDHDWQRPCPPTAQHALRQARTAAANVAASLGFGARQPFTYRTRGVVVDLGPRATVAEMFGIPVRGFPAWLMARAYHAVEVPGLRRKAAVLVEWGSRRIAGPAAADLREVGHPRTLFGEFEGQSAGGTSAGAPPRLPAVP